MWKHIGSWLREGHLRAARGLLDYIKWELFSVTAGSAGLALLQYWWPGQPPSIPGPPEPAKRFLLGLLLFSLALIAWNYLWQLFVVASMEAVRKALEKRRAYRAMWAIDGTWDAAIRAELATRQDIGGHQVDYSLCTQLAIAGAVVSTDEIADEICRLRGITEPKRRALVASAVAGSNNLMWPNGLVVGSGGTTLPMASRILEFSRVCQLADLRRQYGPPRLWT